MRVIEEKTTNGTATMVEIIGTSIGAETIGTAMITVAATGKGTVDHRGVKDRRMEIGATREDRKMEIGAIKEVETEIGEIKDREMEIGEIKDREMEIGEIKDREMEIGTGTKLAMAGTRATKDPTTEIKVAGATKVPVKEAVIKNHMEIGTKVVNTSTGTETTAVAAEITKTEAAMGIMAAILSTVKIAQ